MKRLLPSYPLFIKDPNFSLWSPYDRLTDGDVESWYGEKKQVYGFLKLGGETYIFLGNKSRFLPLGVREAVQTDLKVSAFSTDYTFSVGEATLSLSFISPLLPSDLDMVGTPVCYMDYEITGTEDAFELSLFLGANNCYNDNPSASIDRRTLGGVMPLNGFEASFFGLTRQLPLSNNNDIIGADSGYWYLGGEEGALLDERELFAYLTGGARSFAAQEFYRYIAAFATSKKGTLLVGCDDRATIDYFGDVRRGYMLENYTMAECMQLAMSTHDAVLEKLAVFEEKLRRDTAHEPASYLPILYASLRQSVGGHKLVRNKDGEVLFLSKENGSNGCIATVDVSYPSIPLYLYTNVELVKGMMRPILKFARMPIWKYDFAPHDVGTYPACYGQVYSLVNSSEDKNVGRLNRGAIWTAGQKHAPSTHFPLYTLPATMDIYQYEEQMPVEECANMLVMFLAVCESEGAVSFFRENLDLASKWVEYLVKYGLYPEEQLCTDDFAGHLKNNVNLAIKATVGIGAYARLIGKAGDKDAESKYRSIAEDFAKKITEFANKYSHLPITWDTDDSTFSLKYNLAFDRIYHLDLFSKELCEREVDAYVQKTNTYGTPLDQRELYTKSDWIVWSARLTESVEKRDALLSPIVKYLEESPSRIPFGDWYYTDSAVFRYFRARTVQGGTFILLL